ncbi:hypothetical protein CYLTODRAFT_422915, partial [Cylindrobasidium torrendii FP15055 ss-10]
MTTSYSSLPSELAIPILHYDDPPARPSEDIDPKTSITYTFKEHTPVPAQPTSPITPPPSRVSARVTPPSSSSPASSSSSLTVTVNEPPPPPTLTLVPNAAAHRMSLTGSIPCISVIPSPTRTLVLLSGMESGGPELLGELKFNSRTRTGTFQMRSRGGPLILSDVFTRAAFVNRKCKKEARSTWQWKISGQTSLYWDVSPSGRTLECFSSNFTPSARYATLQNNARKRELNITPAGWDVLDDVVMSALVLERWRWDGL